MIKNRDRRTAITVLGAAMLTFAATVMASMQSALVRRIELPRELPAVGNIEAVARWRLGRLEQVEQQSGTDDVVLQIRTEGREVIRVVGPSRPLVELARVSGWFDPVKDAPGRNDYVERMIAYDVDADGRLIAMMSLEPVPRSNARLRRTFGPG